MTDHDKKISGVEAPMNPVQQQSAPSEGRRRLMKGALAAPAVMTLMHGRLAAAASAICSEKPVVPHVGWTDESGNELVEEDGQLGYWVTVPEGIEGEETRTFIPILRQEQVGFHSLNCWASFPHT